MRNNIIFLLFIALLWGCSETKEKVYTGPQVFEQISSNFSGLDFSNDLKETMEINIKEYEYLYNGGGVSLGDINGDGLQDLYFTGTIIPNKLYLNKGNLQFEDITESAGVAVPDGLKTGTIMIDINNDDLLDIYVTRSGKNGDDLRKNLLFINQGDNTFKEEGDKYGLGSAHNSTHASFFDYDLDGDLDVYLVNHPIDFENCQNVRIQPNQNNEFVRLMGPKRPYDTDQLMRNNGDGTFTEVTEAAGVLNYAWGLSVITTDLTNDGLPDIYVGNDYVEPDFFYINNGDGTFTESLGNEAFQHISNNSMGSDVADFNNDGYLDLIFVDMIGEDQKRQKSLITSMVHDRHKMLKRIGYGDQQMRNVLQLNNGDGTFSEIGQLAGVSHTDWSWSPLFADFDNDGLKDLFISNGYRRDLNNCDYTIYKSDSLSKAKITDIYQYLDLIPANRIRNYLYKNNGNLTFDDVSDHWGLSEKTFSNGATYGDLDNDGDLDLVVNNLDGEVSLFKNKTDSLFNRQYLRIKVMDNSVNKLGVGAKVYAYSSGDMQMEFMNINRGFMSSAEPILHFGFEAGQKVDSLVVEWSNGERQVTREVAMNTEILLDRAKLETLSNPITKSEFIFSQVDNKDLDVTFIHVENDFDDHLREPMIPHGFSTMGPALAVGDINGDGLDDLYLGGAAGQEGVFQVQNINGSFSTMKNDWFKNQHVYEDVNAEFFDYDNDGDLDLFVTSGGAVYNEGSGFYQDRLYQNNGDSFSSVDLPVMYTSTSHVTPLDFDNDGDLDLFIGGRFIPGEYPKIPRSYLLENINNTYKDVTESKAEQLEFLGLVTDSKWLDYDNDGSNELIVVGEWMPISIFEYNDGALERVSDNSLADSHGWWNTIETGDFDDDGDVDFIVGNLGLNSLYTASVDEPFTVVAKDFDGNGSYDAILNKYIDGVSWPVPQKNTMIKQVPKLQKRFTKYDKYSSSTINDFFEKDDLEDAQKLNANVFASTYFENRGSEGFAMHELPIEAQIAPIYAINLGDFDNDGNLDAVIGGNITKTEVERGPYDAHKGLVLMGRGDGSFDPLRALESGFSSNKELRHILTFQRKGKKHLAIASNNSEFEFYKIND